MADAHANFAYSTIGSAPSPGTAGTVMVVGGGDGALFPTPPFNATVWPANTRPLAANAEIVRVTAISTDTFTVSRTQESTSARSIIVGDQIAATVTKKTLTDIESGGSSGVTQICDSLLGSAQATFDTNTILGGNVPSTYKHLRLLAQLRGDTAANVITSTWLRFNNDSTANNYRYENSWNGNNAFASTTDTGLELFAGTCPAGNLSAGIFGALVVDVYDYASTTAIKVVTALARGENNTTQFVVMSSGRWQTSAITRLQLVPSAGNFATGSRFTLYGFS